jgi:hypothetical protein
MLASLPGQDGLWPARVLTAAYQEHGVQVYSTWTPFLADTGTRVEGNGPIRVLSPALS